jgi:hypothetical protein
MNAGDQAYMNTFESWGKFRCTILHKARWPWPGRCAVCGAWGWFQAWDEGLQGRFCTDCFDHVVDAEAALASQGLVCRARAAAARRPGEVWPPWMELGALRALWGGGVAWPWEAAKEGPLSPERRRAQGGAPIEGARYAAAWGHCRLSLWALIFGLRS